MNWISQTMVWYAYIFVIGLVFLPLTAKIYRRFYDFGYPFAKTLGLIFGSFLIYILGIAHVLPFTRESIFFSLVLLAIFFYRSNPFKVKITRGQIIVLIIEEVIFIMGLIFLTLIRGHEPSIHGLEKFMDFGFMQTISRSTYFPPTDMWLSSDAIKPLGYPINYYYFGHLVGAYLIKLTDISAYVGYNLILATILAQGASLTFSLSANIVHLYQGERIKKKISELVSLIATGGLGALLVNLGGNLHTIYITTKGYPNEHPVPYWGIFQSIPQIVETMKSTGRDFLSSMISNSSYWYPNATRFIPFTIHEFPSYSYVVADLHGHVFDIPFVLVTLSIILLIYIHIKSPPKNDVLQTISSKKLAMIPYINLKNIKINFSKYEFFLYVFLGFMIAVNYMTNAFDGPIYILLALLVLGYLYRFKIGFFIRFGIVMTSMYLVSRPFSFFFSPFSSKIGVNCSPNFLVKLKSIGPFLFEKGNCQLSEPWMLFVLWGFFWIMLLLFYFNMFGSNLKIAIIKIKDYIFHKQKFKLNFDLKVHQLDIFLYILFGFGTFLIVIPEFFYAKDIYPAHFRANTMFKLGYQAYIVMSVASAIVFYRLMRMKNPAQAFVNFSICGILFVFILIYPYLAFPSYYPNLFDRASYSNIDLDGSKWLQRDHPDSKEIVDYINENISGQPNILEAQGDSYTDNNVVSSYTGLPTVAGWWVHEWLWRGSADVVGSRIPDIVSIYESTDLSTTKELLKKYNVHYVVISTFEKEKYKNLHEDKFSELGMKIFQTNSGFGALYRIH